MKMKETERPSKSEDVEPKQWDHSTHEEFLEYYAKQSESEATLQRFSSTLDSVLPVAQQSFPFKEKLDVEIPFPIIADGAATVAEKLGMIHPGKGANTVRAVFIVDNEGIVRIVIYYPQEVGRNMDEIVRAVKALQVSDKNDVAIPAGWPKTELIGDEVIVPPPMDEKTAKERPKMYECYDWWFCHKKLK